VKRVQQSPKQDQMLWSGGAHGWYSGLLSFSSGGSSSSSSIGFCGPAAESTWLTNDIGAKVLRDGFQRSVGSTVRGEHNLAGTRKISTGCA
jgi:hypothetical protein